MAMPSHRPSAPERPARWDRAGRLVAAAVAVAAAIGQDGVHANPQGLPAGHADYQLAGAYPPPEGVTIVARDRGDPAAPGTYSICYINAFQTQDYESDWWKAEHPELLLRTADGKLVEDEGWPGEFLLDTSTEQKRDALIEIMGEWIAGCKESGFQAVVADNFDSSSRSEGLLTRENNLDYAQLLAEEAHANGLAIAQKNAADLTAEARNLVGFDFAVAESCQVYDECEDYTAVYGNQVIEIEYTDDGREYFDAACAARGGMIPVMLRDRNLLPAGEPDHHFEAC